MAQFYSSDDKLCATVAEFIAEGLITGQPGILIASAAHTEGILAQLTARSIDVRGARRNGNLVVLDAEELLPMLVPGGEPEPRLFEQHVGRLIEQSRRGRGGTDVRVYGELVDLLCRSGRPDGAVRLEVLWNRLGIRHQFTLLCGYAADALPEQADSIEQIRAQHTRVVSPAPTVRS
jgi:hypothetical protein